MKNENNDTGNQQSHNSSIVRSAAQTSASAVRVKDLKSLIPAAVRDRKFRAHSFTAKLTPEQRVILFDWLNEDTLDEVRARVAAPAPEGFGLAVHRTTLARLKTMINNTELTTCVSDAMDSACDVLDPECPADAAPIRETLSLVLYSRALNWARESFCPTQMNQLLAAIARLEKLKSTPVAPSRPVARLQLDVQFNGSRPVIISPAVSASASQPEHTSAPAVNVSEAFIDGSISPRLASPATSKMLPVIENLLILQDRDRKIMRVEAELANLGPERAALEQRAQRAQTQAEAGKTKAKQLESDRKKLELDVEAKKGLIEKYSLQQFQTKKNEEYRALAHEIEMCKEAISKIEDEQLAVMEQVDAANREAAEISKTSAAVVKDVELARSALADKETRLKRELAELKGDYAQIESAVDETVRDRYIRLRKQRGANVIVGIDRGICGGCHMKLPMQIVLSCQAQQELVNCSNCGRILYFTREMDLAVA